MQEITRARAWARSTHRFKSFGIPRLSNTYKTRYTQNYKDSLAADTAIGSKERCTIQL